MATSSEATQKFEDHVFRVLADALQSVDRNEASRVYVLSIHIYDEDDDPRCPSILLGWNTEDRARATAPRPGEGRTWPIASSPEEARWNYAFWLQNELAHVCAEVEDPRGAELRRTWIEAQGLWYSDELEAADPDAADETGGMIHQAFSSLIARVVSRLHAEGCVERTFSRSLPVVIHDLDDSPETALATEHANPPGFADPFLRWQRGETTA